MTVAPCGAARMPPLPASRRLGEKKSVSMVLPLAGNGGIPAAAEEPPGTGLAQIARDGRQGGCPVRGGEDTAPPS